MNRSKGKNKQTRLLRLVVIVLFAVCLWQGHLVFIDFEGNMANNNDNINLAVQDGDNAVEARVPRAEAPALRRILELFFAQVLGRMADVDGDQVAGAIADWNQTLTAAFGPERRSRTTPGPRRPAGVPR